MSELVHNPNLSVDQAARELMRNRNAVTAEYTQPDPLREIGLVIMNSLRGHGNSPYAELPPFSRQVLEQMQSLPGIEESQPLPRRFVSGNGANIRAEASTGAVDIGDIWEELEVVGPDVAGQSVAGSTLWYQVRLPDGKLGYVHSSVVSQPRVEDREIEGPKSLTSIEFPEAAPDLIDGGTWEYQGQEVQVRVYTDLGAYRQTRSKMVTVGDQGWSSIGQLWNDRFDQIAALKDEVLQLPVYEQNPGWPANMRAADVSAAGAFHFEDEHGQFIEITRQEILQRGINYVLVHQPPGPRIADEPPSASRGQIYYVADRGQTVAFSYKFDADTSQGLTIYMYIGQQTYRYTGDDFKRRYLSFMMLAPGIIWDTALLQQQGEERYGDNLVKIRENIVNRSWGKRLSGRQPWSDLLTGNAQADQWKLEALPHVVVESF